ncbi:DUF192 domain-containing protein [Sphingobium subterraneum]|uniref:DUF192 domain-containing protein n=1 Tax=Sphingobium subterraneum TaxID=627688 RepID=A0A841J6B6_9SPHN|nr:DUF192 domain-containing protein [Sphingobium subterraneum]MBB6125076.1 hypothetical protein [Sphingobium subterraneum]
MRQGTAQNFIAGVALCLVALSGCKAAPERQPSALSQAMPTVPLVIQQGDRGVSSSSFTVEIALTPAQQERGLMFRKSVPDKGGMLFPMDPPRTASFWMKNTLIPLDIIFIRTDGTIAMIAEQTTPHSLAPISAGIPVAAVLELRGGRSRELGLAVDDRVSWGACTARPVSTRPTTTTPDNFCPAP